jgi:hypothetical protein
MLAQARRRSDIEWVLGDLTTWVGRESAFDLIVMTGHAFQVLLGDDELRASLRTVRSALSDAGHFVFETRNPLAKAWEQWTPADAAVVTDSSGNVVRMVNDVEMPVTGDLVRFSTTYSSPHWERARYRQSTLRFLDVARLSEELSAAGLVIEEQFGDWDRCPLDETSPEIITSVRRG